MRLSDLGLLEELRRLSHSAPFGALQHGFERCASEMTKRRQLQLTAATVAAATAAAAH